MTKRIVSVILLCVLMLTVFTGCTEQLGLSIGGTSEMEYKIENGEAIVKQAPDLSTITEVTIPDEYEGCPVTKIDDFSVVNLENVGVINIGKNVKEIGTWAFTNNQKLKEFQVDEENEYFCDVDGVLFTKDMKTILFYPPFKGYDTEEKTIKYEIPEGVETVRTKAFYKCDKLTDIVIPESVTAIEEKAFFRCSSLKALSLPEKLELIGKDAFAYCSAIPETTIPSSVKQIDDYAFYNCTSMLKVIVENEESAITLGKKWYPTKNGQNMDVEIVWGK